VNYNLEIQKLLLETDKLTNPDDRIAVFKEAIKLADANRDVEWAYELRMDLIRAEQYTNHSRESIPAFAWILDAHDNHPDMFSELDILYEYKWLAGVIFNNLDVSLQQIDNILDDFRQRLLRNNFTSREYFNIRINQSLFKGEKMLAREYLDLRDMEPTDNMSSWAADLITTIYVEMLEGDFENALKNITEFVTYRSEHGMNIIHVYSGLIYYLGGKTYDPQIEAYFDEMDKEFSGMKKYPFQLYELSLMMYYMARHRKDRAWVYFEQFVNWEIGAEDSIRFDFALSVLPLLKDGGTRNMDFISVHQPYFKEDKLYNLDDVYQYYLQTAADLAQRFDERNKNKHFSEQLNEQLQQLI